MIGGFFPSGSLDFSSNLAYINESNIGLYFVYQKALRTIFDISFSNTKKPLYIRNFKYVYLTPIFLLHNIHLVFSTCPHKYKWILCTAKLVLNAINDVKI